MAALMYIGAHLSAAGGIHTAVDRAEAIGAESLQLFTQSPRAWRPTNHDPANFDRFRERRAEVGLHGVLCHALYLCNLAAPNDEVYEKSIAALRNTMEVASAIGADAVVFHVGSHLGSGFEHGLERVLPAMEQVLELTTDETWLLMENSAGTGGTIGRSIDELAAIYERLDRHPRLGICLDSCHLYASGVDVTDPARARRAARRGRLVDRARPSARAARERLGAAELGSNRDRHANIGEGAARASSSASSSATRACKACPRCSRRKAPKARARMRTRCERRRRSAHALSVGDPRRGHARAGDLLGALRRAARACACAARRTTGSRSARPASCSERSASACSSRCCRGASSPIGCTSGS